MDAQCTYMMQWTRHDREMHNNNNNDNNINIASTATAAVVVVIVVVPYYDTIDTVHSFESKLKFIGNICA